MSQYRDNFIGGGGGRGSRNRMDNEEYMYRRREEDDGSQYSPTSGDTDYGFPAVPITDIDSRSTSRPTQKFRRPQQPMSSRQGGNGGQNIPPVPRVSSNSNVSRGPPPRPVRSNYVASNLDSSEVQEVRQNPNFSYRLNQQPVRTRYPQSDDEHEPISPTNLPTNRPSVSSSRSIFIGFDPSNSPGTTNTNSLGVIPNFPPVPPIPSGSNRKSLGTGPPPSARRGTSSYYSQQALMVSPIPEESSSSSSDRHGSYASSAAIPSSWAAAPLDEYYSREDHQSDSDEYESRIPIDTFVEVEEERGLVRQASLGRKSRPIITEIRAGGGSKSSGSNESFKTSRSAGGSTGIGRATSRSPAEKSSPTLNPVLGGSASSSLPSIAGPQAQSPATSSAGSVSPIAQPPAAFTTDDYMGEQFNFSRRASQAGSQVYELSSSPWEANTASTKLPAPVGGISGRRIPPRLNMDAVREAEARGSLTSLPDLIRRATKLAAVLETGRPDSRWGRRGSYMGSSSGGRSNGRDTDSISDILASFPPPVLAQGKNRGTRTLSQWPLPGDFTHENDSSIRPSRKQGRRICGLPLWAFVLLVILALLVISAAVIVPLQLVNLSKADKDDSDSGTALVAQCKEKNPCQNGGENIATSDFCGCVCTNGFTGSNCSEKDDLSCTTVDLKDRMGGRIKGIQNVTMGNALPRLFDIADPYYNIELDMAMVLAVFSNESISCTAQNALVTFNGESIPSSAITTTTTTGRRALADAINELEKRQETVTATITASAATVTASGTPISTESRTPELDPDAIDFARVVVLYLTNVQTLLVASEAQTQLQAGFTAGRDFGDLSVGNNVTVDFDNRSIELSDGTIVGSVTANSTNTTTSSSEKVKRSVLGTYIDDILS